MPQPDNVVVKRAKTGLSSVADVAGAVLVPCAIQALIIVSAKSWWLDVPWNNVPYSVLIGAIPGFMFVLRLAGRRAWLIAPFYFLAMYFVLLVFSIYFVGYVYDDWL